MGDTAELGAATPAKSDADERGGVDLEALAPSPVAEKAPAPPTDIEHALVRDDPRMWTKTRKTVTLLVVSSAAMIAGLGANIYNPAIQQIEQELHASSAEISWSISLFILIQGNAPIIWSSISEIKGRKMVYLVSIALSIVGCAVVASSKTIGLVIGMRCVQAAGSSAVIAIGAATLADIYEPSERGTMMGIYYSAPLLGPSLGPILGGALAQGFNWRATFWFMVIFCGLNLVSFVFLFKDTFRRERSLAYQLVLKRDRERALRSLGHSREQSRRPSQETMQMTDVALQTAGAEASAATDKEKAPRPSAAPPSDRPTPVVVEIKPSFKDVNPFPPLWQILHRLNNLLILIASGLLFAFSYCISYTSARTLGTKYGYDPLRIGLVLLAFGIGSMCGSVLGGRWSDRMLAKLQAANGGKRRPEMRLESTKLGLFLLPPCVVTFGWLSEERVHVAAICVFLFLTGFLSIWIYSSTLAYIVDANVGRSSTAVATNSGFRGLLGFVAAELAVPLQDSIGDGGTYTLWMGLMLVVDALIFLLIWKGGRWRERAIAREEAR